MAKQIKVEIIISGKMAEEPFAVDEQDIHTFLEDDFGYPPEDVQVKVIHEEK